MVGLARELIMRTSHETDHIPTFRPSRASLFRDRIGLLQLCFARWRERRALGELSNRQLKDVGLSRSDVERERRRWPWDGCPRNR